MDGVAYCAWLAVKKKARLAEAATKGETRRRDLARTIFVVCLFVEVGAVGLSGELRCLIGDFGSLIKESFVDECRCLIVCWCGVDIDACSLMSMLEWRYTNQTSSRSTRHGRICTRLSALRSWPTTTLDALSVVLSPVQWCENPARMAVVGKPLVLQAAASAMAAREWREMSGHDSWIETTMMMGRLRNVTSRKHPSFLCNAHCPSIYSS